MAAIRSLFISDVHLGCKYANADALLAFLKSHQPEYLYLVGDILDGWRLRARLVLAEVYNRLVKRLFKMIKRGTRVYYAPGNHDEFLRGFISNLGKIDIADQFRHVTADGRHILVLHGDQFDSVVRHARWLSLVGDKGYDVLLVLNQLLNVARRRFGMGYWSLSAAIKRKVKRATNFISDFENVVTRHAAEMGCDGVVCGHIHNPSVIEKNGVVYYNTGDWVESCSALVEYDDGILEIVHRPMHQHALPVAAGDHDLDGWHEEAGDFEPQAEGVLALSAMSSLRF